MKSGTQHRTNPAPDELGEANQEPLHLQIGSIIVDSNTPEGFGYDWALIALDDTFPQDGNHIEIPDAATGLVRSIYLEGVGQTIGEVDCYIASSRGDAIKCQVMRTPSFLRAENSKAFQEVWPIIVDKDLCEYKKIRVDVVPCLSIANRAVVPGDCGAWVIDPREGQLLGHIVAGNPRSRMAYMSRARDIFDDIESVVGHRVEREPGHPTRAFSTTLSLTDRSLFDMEDTSQVDPAEPPSWVVKSTSDQNCSMQVQNHHSGLGHPNAFLDPLSKGEDAGPASMPKKRKLDQTIPCPAGLATAWPAQVTGVRPKAHPTFGEQYWSSRGARRQGTVWSREPSGLSQASTGSVWTNETTPSSASVGTQIDDNNETSPFDLSSIL